MQLCTKAYCLFVNEEAEQNEWLLALVKNKKGQYHSKVAFQEFFDVKARNYFAKPYGEKFKPNTVTIAQGFHGKVEWQGNYSLNLEGDFGPDFRQIVSWRNNIPIFSGQAIDLWLEYKKSEDVHIVLVATQFQQGTLDAFQQRWEFNDEELKNVCVLDNQMGDGPVFFSLLAKGKGSLSIISLHDRHSRRGLGTFLPGGDRYVTSDREEIFCYFDPGDCKPPLNVYFSGYKTMEGFEGYNLMRNMGGPFLLVSESRMEGGNFYMGSEEYETMLKNAILKYIHELGFTEEDVIFSGLSMGTYGALYYGCDIRPHAIVLGKPLASIGDVAANERIHRPGGFPTSLDVLNYVTGGIRPEHVETLNKRFWDKFDATDWNHTKFIISYMIEDDYDMTAYNTLISHLSSDGVQVYGKGIHGRHNDNTGAIVGWFSGQYEKLLLDDFHRVVEKPQKD